MSTCPEPAVNIHNAPEPAKALPGAYLSNAACMGLYYWDVENDEHYCSNAVLKVLGIHETGFDDCFKEIKARLHPDDVSDGAASLKASLLTNDIGLQVFRLRHEADHYVPFLLDGQVFYNQTGQAQYWLGALINLAAMPNFQEPFDIQDYIAAKVFEDLKICLMLADSDLGIILANEPMADHIGIGLENLRSGSLDNLLDVRRNDAMIQHCQHVLAVRRPLLGQLVAFPNAKGPDFSLKVNYTPHKNPVDGKPCVLIVARNADNVCAEPIDFTDREKHLRKIMDVTSDGYWDWHLLDDYEYMSPRFWDMLGHDPKTKRHHPSEWQKLIDPDDL